MAERPGRQPRKPHSAQVVRTERLTPHMQRVVLGGEGLADFAAGTCTDHYVKLLFAPEGVTYPEPFDMQRIRDEVPREQWPVTRTYTVRQWDAEHRELTLDFVIHGDEGLAAPGRCASSRARPCGSWAPAGRTRPTPTPTGICSSVTRAHCRMIACALEALPRGAKAYAFVEISGPEEEQKIDSDVDVVWLHRGDRPLGEALVEAVRSLEFPEGRVHAFVHGEAHFVKELRHLLRVERHIAREDLSISGYWRRGHNEDGWQASKRDWNARIEAEQESSPAA